LSSAAEHYYKFAWPIIMGFGAELGGRLLRLSANIFCQHLQIKNGDPSGSPF
jgi:hypothetical protein